MTDNAEKTKMLTANLLSTEQIKRVIRAAFFTPGVNGRWGLPVLFEGPPGTGKTSILREFTDGHGIPLEVVLGSIRAPEDITGLPIPTEEGVEYRAPGWAIRLKHAGLGLCFLDELNSSAPATQAALLRVSLEGVVGDLELGPRVRFFAAQNPTEQSAGGWELAPPLANRFGHFAWPAPSVDEWSTWLLGTGGRGEATAKTIDAAAEEKRVMDAWEKPFAQARALVTSFIRARAELLHKQPPVGNPQASKAWPSPRTWEMATRAMASSWIHGLTPGETEEFVAAFVGGGAAGELMDFVQKIDLPDPEEVLDGKVVFEADDRLDRTMAVLSACAAMVVPATAKDREKRATLLWGIIHAVSKNAPDIAVQPATNMVIAGLNKGKMEPISRPALAKLQPVMDAAGML